MHPVPGAPEPLDPDVDLTSTAQAAEVSSHPWTLVAVAVGGGIGALARHAVGLALADASAGFPWSTLVVNVVGALAIGLLMALLTAAPAPHPLLRPALGVGLLGGFTTFSTAMVDTLALSAPLGIAYALGTLVPALLAVVAGLALGERLAERRWPR